MAAVIGNRNISLGVLGGTLITAACYSGGNVFGCSPYDKATTAYLEATYPSYWAQIRDYGFANPQLVPWINEDNDLIVSLVSVGKERWLVGDGVAYIKTGYIPNTSSGFKEVIKAPTNFSIEACPFGCRAYTDGRFWFHLFQFNVQCAVANEYPAVYSFRNGERLDFEYNYFEADCGKINGNIVKEFNHKRPTSYIEAYLMATNLIGSAGWFFYGKMLYNKITEGQNVVRNFVPCTHNGEAGMLDIVNAQWYGNANTSGAFTIELTDTPS